MVQQIPWPVPEPLSKIACIKNAINLSATATYTVSKGLLASKCSHCSVRDCIQKFLNPYW